MPVWIYEFWVALNGYLWSYSCVIGNSAICSWLWAKNCVQHLWYHIEKFPQKTGDGLRRISKSRNDWKSAILLHISPTTPPVFQWHPQNTTTTTTTAIKTKTKTTTTTITKINQQWHATSFSFSLKLTAVSSLLRPQRRHSFLMRLVFRKKVFFSSIWCLEKKKFFLAFSVYKSEKFFFHHDSWLEQIADV